MKSFEAKPQEKAKLSNAGCHWSLFFKGQGRVPITYSVARLCPVLGSQNLIGCWLSLLPETTNPLVGCQSTHFTSAPWPVGKHIRTKSHWSDALQVGLHSKWQKQERCLVLVVSGSAGPRVSMPPILLCSVSSLLWKLHASCSPTCWQVSHGFLEDALCRLFKHLMLVISVLKVNLHCSVQCSFFRTVWGVLSQVSPLPLSNQEDSNHIPGFLLLFPEVFEEKQCLTSSHKLNMWKQKNATKNHRCEKPDWTRQRNVYGFGKAILYRVKEYLCSKCIKK